MKFMLSEKVSKEGRKEVYINKRHCNHAIRDMIAARVYIMNKHESAMNTNHL